MCARGVIVAIIAVLQAGCSTSAENLPQAELQTSPEPGTVFLFSDGRAERFLRVEAGDFIWSTRNGREYARHANPILPVQTWRIGERSGESKVFGDDAQLWPPAPGKRAHFRVLNTATASGQQRRTVQAWACRVDQPEHLTVAASDFEVLPITCELYSVSSMRLLEKRTWWWSTDLHHYVKRAYQSMRTGAIDEIKLCAALPSYRAAEARLDNLLRDCAAD